MYIDTHCHLDDSRFFQIENIICDYKGAGVEFAITMGCDAQSSISASELSKIDKSIYFACGVHPSEVQKIDSLTIEQIKTLAKQEKCVAIGEIGLDYHWEPFDKEKQKDLLALQIELANQLDLPVCLHSRDATLDMLDLLKSVRPKKGGVMHCFSGSKETAAVLLDMGLYLGFGGTVTFKNSTKLKEVAIFAPEDRILTETDSPYLSPEPYRGRVNSPKNIPIICEYLSGLKKIELEKFASIIMQNAKNLFYKIK